MTDTVIAVAGVLATLHEGVWESDDPLTTQMLAIISANREHGYEPDPDIAEVAAVSAAFPDQVVVISMSAPEAFDDEVVY